MVIVGGGFIKLPDELSAYWYCTRHIADCASVDAIVFSATDVPVDTSVWIICTAAIHFVPPSGE